jgi:hypothetical protein
MALALIVYKNGPEDQQAETSRLFFFVGGIAALTLVINATTAKSLLFKLGLLGGDSAEKELVMEQIKKKLKKQLSVVFASIAKDYGFNEKELDEVKQACTLFADTDLTTLLEIANKGSGGGGTSSKKNIISTSTSQRTRKKSLSNDNDNYSSTYNPILTSSEVDSSNSNSNNLLMNNQNSQDILDDIERAHSLPMLEQRGRKGSTASAGSGIVDDELGGGRGRRVSAADHFKRRLSIDVRGPSPVMTAQLLKYVRSIFLSMVRVSYWHDIEQGKLPRKSKSAKFLLYSIEVGQEDAIKEDGGGSDWRCIEDKLNSTPHEIKLLTMIENMIPPTYFYGFHSRYLNKLECNREERHVYMVTSFISAHEHAQRKLHDFIKVEEDDPHSPEEMKVIAESIISVR